jgi:hypothetical protein
METRELNYDYRICTENLCRVMSHIQQNQLTTTLNDAHTILRKYFQESYEYFYIEPSTYYDCPDELHIKIYTAKTVDDALISQHKFDTDWYDSCYDFINASKLTFSLEFIDMPPDNTLDHSNPLAEYSYQRLQTEIDRRKSEILKMFMSGVGVVSMTHKDNLTCIEIEDIIREKINAIK